MVEVNVPETHKQRRLMFVKTFDIFLIYEKKGNGVYIHDTKSLYAAVIINAITLPKGE